MDAQCSTTRFSSLARQIAPYLNPYTIAVAALAANFLIVAFYNWRQRRAERVFTVQYGCRSLTSLMSWWSFNLSYLYKFIQADSAKRFLSYCVDQFNDTGDTFLLNLFGNMEIFTSNPENVEAVLNTNFNDYWFGASRVDKFKPLFGSGIFTQDGPAWRHSRSLLRPQFMHNRTFYFSHIQEQARRMAAIIDIQAAGKKIGELDLEPIFFRYTLDTTTSMLFGKPVSGHDDQAAVGKFVDAFTQGQAHVVERLRLGPLALVLSDREQKHHAKVCHDFVDGIVQEARQREKHRKILGAKPGEVENDNLLESLLHLYPEDDVAIRSQLMNILLAGRDTTACLLTWCFRLLALHPAVLQKLYEEIATLPETADLSRHDLHKSNAPYLAAVLRETLRLYPSVPANQRTARQMTYLPRGGGPDQQAPVLLRKGWKVTYVPYVIHRRKDIWGDDADIFRPERWIEDDGELEKRTASAYIPFNTGPRTCLGQDMALSEASVGVVHILKAWNGGMSLVGDGKLGPNGETGQEQQECGIMLRPLAGCKVVLSRT